VRGSLSRIADPAFLRIHGSRRAPSPTIERAEVEAQEHDGEAVNHRADHKSAPKDDLPWSLPPGRGGVTALARQFPE
jgi:hypothetical protein